VVEQTTTKGVLNAPAHTRLVVCVARATEGSEAYTDLLRLQKNYFLLKDTLDFARKSLKNALNNLVFPSFLCKFTFSATSLGEVHPFF
jgi:hypothetical protein